MYKILTEKEAAAWLGVSTRTLQRLAREGRGPLKVRLTDRRVGYREPDLEGWVEARIEHPAGTADVCAGPRESAILKNRLRRSADSLATMGNGRAAYRAR